MVFVLCACIRVLVMFLPIWDFKWKLFIFLLRDKDECMVWYGTVATRSSICKGTRKEGVRNESSLAGARHQLERETN